MIGGFFFSISKTLRKFVSCFKLRIGKKYDDDDDGDVEVRSYYRHQKSFQARLRPNSHVFVMNISGQSGKTMEAERREKESSRSDG